MSAINDRRHAPVAGVRASEQQALRLLREARMLLASRGLCGQWIPCEATVCARRARHPGACGYYSQQEAA